jgi:outer membrane protein insertion porin family
MAGSWAMAQPLDNDKASDPSRNKPAASNAPAPVPAAPAADTLTPYQDRSIRDIKLVGVRERDMELVSAQVRARVGSPLSPEIVRGDVSRLTRLGRFREILAEVTPLDDGSVVLAYRCTPTPIIDDVQAVGNRQITDNELSGEISLLRNTPLDEFQLGSAAARIRKLYRNKGYYNASVQVSQEIVEEKVVVVFTIIEGDRVRITDIRFKGNNAFSPRQLGPNIKSETSGLFETGAIDEEKLDQDVANLVTFYKDRGYLDVRADRELTFAPNGREAIVTFLLSEGQVYTLREVKAAGADPDAPAVVAGGLGKAPPPRVLSAEQIAGLLEIKPGDVYSANKIRKSLDSIRNAYSRMGYVDARVQKFELRDESKPEVDLLLVVDEGRHFKTGVINIAGNDITQRKVILRELDNIRPDRPLDTSGQRRNDKFQTEAERRLEESRLFEPGSIKMTVQPERPENPGYRDVLLELKETNTGSFNFGAAVSSDAGVTGLVSLNQRNFAWDDFPDSFGELTSGRAFRGGGQIFNISLAPGTELQTYAISLTDPALFDTDYTGSLVGSYRQREYDEYDEDRLTGRISLGRRFGQRWGGSIAARFENVDIHNIDPDSPVDLFEVEGASVVTGLGANLVRTTVDSRFRATEGSRVELGAERVGVFGGDYEFTKLNAEYQVYFPIYENFLGLKTVMSVKTAAQYIPEGNDEAPVFERYYLGGSSFRGFRYRTISPKGIRNDTMTLGDDPVGGSWSFFAGTEIEQPVFQDVISVVGFIDSGTVTDDIGFDDYRLSAGVGLRFRVPALGPAPLAFDFGFPILKHFGDRERNFSFTIDLPF